MVGLENAVSTNETAPRAKLGGIDLLDQVSPCPIGPEYLGQDWDEALEFIHGSDRQVFFAGSYSKAYGCA